MTTATATRPRSSLTAIVNALVAIDRSYDDLADREAGWDGGEWSGPAVSRAHEQAVRDALAAHGWTAVDYEDEVLRRTTPHFAYFSGLTRSVQTARCDECGGIRRDVVSTRDTGGHDPYTLCYLACGHVTM